MTISIKKIIDVSSILPSPVAGRRNFAYATFIQKSNKTETRSYSSAIEVAEDLGSNSEAYKASLKYFAGGFNGIKPTQFYVRLINQTGLTSSTQGNFTSGDASANLAALIAVDDGKFTIAKDGGSAIDIEVDLTSATTFAGVASLLQEAIRLADASLRNVNVAYVGDNFVFTSDTYGSTSAIAIGAGDATDLTGANYFNGGSATAGTTGTLAALITSTLGDNRYYHLILSNEWSVADILEWSSAVQAATRITYLLWAITTNADVADDSLDADTGSIARILFDRKASKTCLVYDSSNTDYKQASFPSYFGIVDFTAGRPLGALAFKQFASISATDLDSAQFDNLKAKFVNFYSTFGETGRVIAYEGRSCGGSMINDIIAVDWIDYNMTYNIFDLVITLPRVGFEAGDFAKLEQAIERVYLDALASGIIAGGTDPDTGETLLNGYSIALPNPSTVSSADKQAGLIKNITTVGLLRGSATKFVITNTLKF
jgi:hypothetical protein